MLERSNENGFSEEVDVDDLFVALKHKTDSNTTLPTCVASSEVKLHAKEIGTVGGRLLLGTAEKIPPSELIDTTGASDSFIGAVLYAPCTDMPPEKMLPFASQVVSLLDHEDGGALLPLRMTGTSFLQTTGDGEHE